MNQLASLSRAGILAALTVGLAGACGGQSFRDGDSTGGSSPGGGSQGGSSSTAGSTSHAGSTGKGGSAQGGTGVGAAGSGQGGSVNDSCSTPPDPGMCDAYFPAWYHDPNTGVCMPFVYGGCGGNANRYESLDACQKACPGGTPNYDACKVASDCTVTGTGCCGICDGPNISAHDLIAYSTEYAGFFQCGIALDKAGDSAGAAAPVACAPCPAALPGQGSLMYFVPDCVRGECTVLDLRKSPLTACEKDEDCRIRRGTGCCESCSAEQPIAVRSDGSFEKFVCGDGPVPCPACVPAPVYGHATCFAGQCEITDTLR